MFDFKTTGVFRTVNHGTFWTLHNNYENRISVLSVGYHYCVVELQVWIPSRKSLFKKTTKKKTTYPKTEISINIGSVKMEKIK